MVVKIDSGTKTLKELLRDKYEIDYYQRDYVWKKDQLEELLGDVSREFLKQCKEGHDPENVEWYNPYYMGEIVLSKEDKQSTFVIDGQQRMTTFTLILLYILNKYGNYDDIKEQLSGLIYSTSFGKKRFNLDVPERRSVMESLKDKAEYTPKETDSESVINILNRYNDIEDCWDVNIDDKLIVMFTYWLTERILFTVVTTNDSDYAYVIFESMNDRGLPLTPIDMLRSFLLSQIKDKQERILYKSNLDDALDKLRKIKLNSRMKPDTEFFRMFFRSNLAETLNQKDPNSDFVVIGKSFYKWIRKNSSKLNIENDEGSKDFINRIVYFSNVYIRINNLIETPDVNNFYYLLVNDKYSFSMQPAPILAAVKYEDTEDVIDEKIKILSNYICKVLSWKVWNQKSISQSNLEHVVYRMCQSIRDNSVDELKKNLELDPMDAGKLTEVPILNHQNGYKMRTLLTLITDIINTGSRVPKIIEQSNLEIEHIWSNHPEQHLEECTRFEFSSVRDTVGDLMILPKQYNASFGDLTYEEKLEYYAKQNLLVASLDKGSYEHNPGFLQFMNETGLEFKSYENFNRQSIEERSELYKQILLWNWSL